MKKNWKITGIVATFIIAVVMLLQVLKYYIQSKDTTDKLPVFTGTQSCIECHQVEYDLWLASDHAGAMAVATAQTVLGNFDNAALEHRGFQHKFYKKEDRFFVYTQGPDKKPGEYEISYTFGLRPLQQYLVEFPGGRLQCLPIAWDTEKRRWYHLAHEVYAGEEISPDDWLYWTNLGQNWNGMCADCHSTELKKNLDFETMTFQTTWKDINVGCEACHGPGSAHLDWAKLPEGERPMDANTGLVVKTSNIDNRDYIDNCARCHSRRSALADFDHRTSEFLDYCLPQAPVDPLYFDDGQILEENYVYGSFLQSKMFMKGVRCSDCHNSHSLKFIREGNDLCLQCHRADLYDTYSHHFHKKNGREHQPQVFNSPALNIEGEGARCINCHMDGRYYMGVDYRRDHSFRVPRPDLTIALGVPNACNNCHSDKSAQWSQDYFVKWYGISTYQHYGSVLAAARTEDPGVLDELVKIAQDELQAPMVRAAACTYLGAYSVPEATQALRSLMGHSDPLIRLYASRSFNPGNLQEFKDTYLPLLADPVSSVRMEASYHLSHIIPEVTDSIQRRALLNGLNEYEASMKYSGDFAASRHNLGNLYQKLGRMADAEKQFRASLQIDNQFFPAKVNLANFLNSQGRNEEAEHLLKEVLRDNPDVQGVHYSLGLLLAEMQKYEEALVHFNEATEESPWNARIFYNYGLLLNQLGDRRAAEENLLKAASLEPGNSNFIYALSTFYYETGNREKAIEYGEKLLALNPSDPSVRQFLENIKR